MTEAEEFVEAFCIICDKCGKGLGEHSHADNCCDEFDNEIEGQKFANKNCLVVEITTFGSWHRGLRGRCAYFEVGTVEGKYYQILGGTHAGRLISIKHARIVGDGSDNGGRERIFDL